MQKCKFGTIIIYSDEIKTKTINFQLIIYDANRPNRLHPLDQTENIFSGKNDTTYLNLPSTL